MNHFRHTPSYYSPQPHLFTQPSPSPHIKLNRYQILQQIGQSPHAKIHLGKDTQSNRSIAVKIMDTKNCRGFDRNRILNEARCHAKCRHASIIELIDYFEVDNSFYLVMEFAERGDLFHFLKKRSSGLSDMERRRIMLQVCRAVDAVHDQGLVHRDIKPENILLDGQLNAKLADFGWSCSVSDTVGRAEMAGTFEYMAPECLRKEPQDGAADIWSLGILVFELYHGKEPFKGKSKDQILHSIYNTKCVFRQDTPDEAVQVFIACVCYDPRNRIKIKDLLAHSYFDPVLRQQSESPTHKRAKASVISPRHQFTSLMGSFEMNRPSSIQSPRVNSFHSPSNLNPIAAVFNSIKAPCENNSSYTSFDSPQKGHIAFSAADTPKKPSGMRIYEQTQLNLTNVSASQSRAQSISNLLATKQDQHSKPGTTPTTRLASSQAQPNVHLFDQLNYTTMLKNTVLGSPPETQTSFYFNPALKTKSREQAIPNIVPNRSFVQFTKIDERMAGKQASVNFCSKYLSDSVHDLSNNHHLAGIPKRVILDGSLKQHAFPVYSSPIQTPLLPSSGVTYKKLQSKDQTHSYAQTSNSKSKDKPSLKLKLNQSKSSDDPRNRASIVKVYEDFKQGKQQEAFDGKASNRELRSLRLVTENNSFADDTKKLSTHRGIPQTASLVLENKKTGSRIVESWNLDETASTNDRIEREKRSIPVVPVKSPLETPDLRDSNNYPPRPIKMHTGQKYSSYLNNYKTLGKDQAEFDDNNNRFDETKARNQSTESAKQHNLRQHFPLARTYSFGQIVPQRQQTTQETSRDSRNKMKLFLRTNTPINLDATN